MLWWVVGKKGMNNRTSTEYVGSLQGWNITNLFCPYFCRKKQSDVVKLEQKNEWQLTDKELKTICSHLNIEDDEGFSGIFPHKLHNKWEEYMLPQLYEAWVVYIYGSRDEILPDLKRFSELVKGQRSGSVEVKVKIIFAILLEKSYEEMENCEVQISKCDIVKYFFYLLATYLRGMGLRNNPQFLMWMSCDVDLNENNLLIAMMFFAEELPDMAEQVHLRQLMNDHYILSDVLRSVIEMCFGIAPIFNCIIPFPISAGRTILDMAQIVMLTSFVGGCDLYEWEMLYSTARHGCSWLYFDMAVLEKGPTILVLRDREDWIFGGYASVAWKLSSKFYGNNLSFLFRLYPTFKIFRPSFQDENFMYLNYDQDTSPTGLAMGGNLDCFGFWINIDKPVGRCNHFCSTFKNYECLSGTSNFFYVDMEVWRLSPRVVLNYSHSPPKFHGYTLK